MFTTRNVLAKRARTHSGEKLYTCKQCGKSFTQPGNLRVHERTHGGEKPYTCKQCWKSFTTAGSLRVHERTHNGEKPYTCRQCGKSFTQAGHLRLHERTHGGEKQCVKSCNHVAVSEIYGDRNTEEEKRDIEGNICVACPKSHAGSRQVIMEEISHHPQHNNTHEVTSLAKEQEFSQSAREICWICQEEFDNEPSLIEHYDNHMEFVETLE